MTFTRLGRGDLLAMIAALALLLVMALDWYSTKQAEQIRHDQGLVQPSINRADDPKVSTQLGEAADMQEKNAWQADALIDRLILIGMVAAVALALGAAWARAADRQGGGGRRGPGGRAAPGGPAPRA